MDGQEYVNLLVLAQNVEDQLLEIKQNLQSLKKALEEEVNQSLQRLKKALEEIEIKDMGELQ